MLVHVQTKKKKNHEVACEGIEPQFFTLQNLAQYSTSRLQKNKATSKKTTNHPNPTK
jgi:hypothetical protein